MYQIDFAPTAVREWKKLSRIVQERLRKILPLIEEDPFHPVLNIKKLKNPLHGYRLRVGEYRLLYDIEYDTQSIVVYSVVHRKDAYKRK